MAVYFVTGKLGSGKSLAAVGRIRDYLASGRRVATNLDLYLDQMFPGGKNKQVVVRLPDKPRLCDLELLGTGDDKPMSHYDESRFGLLVLDEMASWFNSRGWAEKSRHEVIEWFLHARKLHWDILFLIQDLEAVDKQLRGALAEHVVTCRRLDRIPIPLLSGLFKLVAGKRALMPKVHVGVVRYGSTEGALVVDRWWYSGRELYGSYMTGQAFRDDIMITSQGEVVDMRAPYSLLSSWHLLGRYAQRRPRLLERLEDGVRWLFVAVLRVAARVAGRSPGALAVEWGIAAPALRARHRRLRLIAYGRRLRIAWGMGPVPAVGCGIHIGGTDNAALRDPAQFLHKRPAAPVAVRAVSR